MRSLNRMLLILSLALLAACTPSSSTVTIGRAFVPVIAGGGSSFIPTTLSIRLGQTNVEDGLALDDGGDVDTAVVSAGNPPQEARRTGNDAVLPSPDDNDIADSYMQFQVDDSRLFGGRPTAHVVVRIEYLDQGTDSFRVQYDALPSATSDGLFIDGGRVVKTGSNAFRTLTLALCDVNFTNRTNGGDFRIDDDRNGAETIRYVEVTLLPPGGATVYVDNFGADPFDDRPDSEAIQAALDRTCSGSRILFTSGAEDPTYRGYLIDRTLYLTGTTPKWDMVFTSSLPFDHAMLRATADLKGPVVHLYARSRVIDPGAIDNITLRAIDIHGNRVARRCFGADGAADGRDDNWGSWLPECDDIGDSWCTAANIQLNGAIDWDEAAQDYSARPERWSTGIVVEDMVSAAAECGSALGLSGAAGVIRNVRIDVAGDHVHAPGCAFTDNDGDVGGWSDGITFTGPGHLITGNTIINPSDIGIVFFGGRDTTISGNTVQITAGHYGAFAGIAAHGWIYGDNGGLVIADNVVTSEGDSTCGGLHAGIDLGPHMWGGGCMAWSHAGAVGNAGACVLEPEPPGGALCGGGACQVWNFAPSAAPIVLRNNQVTGAHINYLIEGIDGPIVATNNSSATPRLSDWETATHGCDGLTWGPLHRVAHHPSLPGWEALRVHCVP